jgi:hypothetical protein
MGGDANAIGSFGSFGAFLVALTMASPVYAQSVLADRIQASRRDDADDHGARQR